MSRLDQSVTLLSNVVAIQRRGYPTSRIAMAVDHTSTPQRTSTLDHFRALELDYDADAEEIRSAYFRLVLTSHPDRNQDDPDAAVGFKKIQQAYEALSKRSAVSRSEHLLRTPFTADDFDGTTSTGDGATNPPFAFHNTTGRRLKSVPFGTVGVGRWLAVATVVTACSAMLWDAGMLDDVGMPGDIWGPSRGKSLIATADSVAPKSVGGEVVPQAFLPLLPQPNTATLRGAAGGNADASSPVSEADRFAEKEFENALSSAVTVPTSLLSLRDTLISAMDEALSLEETFGRLLSLVDEQPVENRDRDSATPTVPSGSWATMRGVPRRHDYTRSSIGKGSFRKGSSGNGSFGSRSGGSRSGEGLDIDFSALARSGRSIPVSDARTLSDDNNFAPPVPTLGDPGGNTADSAPPVDPFDNHRSPHSRFESSFDHVGDDPSLPSPGRLPAWSEPRRLTNVHPPIFDSTAPGHPPSSAVIAEAIDHRRSWSDFAPVDEFVRGANRLPPLAEVGALNSKPLPPRLPLHSGAPALPGGHSRSMQMGLNAKMGLSEQIGLNGKFGEVGKLSAVGDQGDFQTSFSPSFADARSAPLDVGQSNWNRARPIEVWMSSTWKRRPADNAGYAGPGANGVPRGPLAEVGSSSPLMTSSERPFSPPGSLDRPTSPAKGLLEPRGTLQSTGPRHHSRFEW